MTFYKLTASMMTLLMVLLLGGVLSVQFIDSKSYVEEQLYINAQNSASSASLSLTSAKNDKTKMKTMINALFDNGYYELVELLDANRRPVYTMKQKMQTGDVPKWFMDIIDIDPLYAEAQISSGWKPIGYIRVKSDRGLAYRQLYSIFKNTVITFIIFMLVGLLLLHFLLKLVLTSINKIKTQAEAVMKNNFLVVNNASRIREFKQVTSAMNKMVERVKDIFLRNEQIVKKNHEILYRDNLTQLYNRRYLILKLSEYLHADDSRSHGVVIIVQINGISVANKKTGYKNSNSFLQLFAKNIEKISSATGDSVISRINGAEFSILLPLETIESAMKIVSRVKKSFKLTTKEFGLENYLTICCAITKYRHNQTVSSIFASLDNLLAEASIQEDFVAVHSIEGKTKELGKDEWREVITSSIRANEFRTVFQPIIDKSEEKILYKLMLFDIETGKNIYRYGEFLPMAIILGLESAVLELMFQELQNKEFQEDNIGIELFGSILKESEKYIFFERKILELSKRTKKTLFVEISQNDLLSMERHFLERLSGIFEESGIEVVVSRAIANSESHSYFEYLKPSYVKMHASIFFDMDDSSKNAFKMMLQSMGAKLIVVCTKEEEELLDNEDISFIAKIRTINN